MERDAKRLFFILMIIGLGGYLLMSNLKVTVTCSDENGKHEIPLEEWKKEIIKQTQELMEENNQLSKQLEQIKQTCLTF